jgi:hypothetical protein
MLAPRPQPWQNLFCLQYCRRAYLTKKHFGGLIQTMLMRPFLRGDLLQLLTMQIARMPVSSQTMRPARLPSVSQNRQLRLVETSYPVCGTDSVVFLRRCLIDMTVTLGYAAFVVKGLYWHWARNTRPEYAFVSHE